MINNTLCDKLSGGDADQTHQERDKSTVHQASKI